MTVSKEGPAGKPERRVGVKVQAEIAAANDEDWLDSSPFKKQSHTVTAEGLEVDSGINNIIKGSLGLRNQRKDIAMHKIWDIFFCF